MAPFLARGTPVTVFCVQSRAQLQRVVVKHLTAGPSAGWVVLRKPDGSVEHRTIDTLTPVMETEDPRRSESLVFYDREGGRAIERYPLAGIAAQPAWPLRVRAGGSCARPLEVRDCATRPPEIPRHTTKGEPTLGSPSVAFFLRR